MPVHALSTRCGYCGYTVKLAEPSAPAPTRPLPSPGPSRGALIAITAVVVVILGVAAALVVHLGTRSTPEAATTPMPKAAVASATPSARPPEPAREETTKVRYPLRSLLGVSVTVDIDGSRSHVFGLFPTIETRRHGDELRYVVPLEHRWFSEVELGWKNESAGKLTSVAIRPPEGDDKFKNQKEIGDCLAKGLGKPEVRETDHLAGEQSFFWGKNFPKAWANLYSSYLWLTFQNPKGIPPITFENVVRTLDACTPKTP